MRHILVVGASLAGLTVVETLRGEAFEGKITVVGSERTPPYDRPPLSKQVLSGAWSPSRALLRSPAALDALGANFRLGVRATGLDLTARRVQLDGIESVEFDGLVIATGARPRPLPSVETIGVSGVFTLRTLEDVLQIREALTAQPRVVIVGGGFLGTEVAATLRRLHLAVSIVEPAPTLLFRQFGPEVGHFVRDLHLTNGVDVRCGVGIAGLTTDTGRLTGVCLTDANRVHADMLVVAIGALPETAWLEGSGLGLSNGVDCDPWGRAAPRIVAAGDVANWLAPGLGRAHRREHRMNATEQAATAARTLLGADAPVLGPSFFWTEQYGSRLQAWGDWTSASRLTVLAGSLHDGKFIAQFDDGRNITAVLGCNMPRELRGFRETLGNRISMASRG